MTNDVSTRTGLEKLNKLLPLIQNFDLLYLQIIGNGPVISYTEGLSSEVPMKAGESFTAEEVESIASWIKTEGSLITPSKSLNTVVTAFNLNGRLYRAEDWGSKSNLHIRFYALDYREVEADDLKALMFSATADQQTEEALDVLSRSLYGEKVSDLDEEDHNDLRDLINKVLAGR